MELIVLSETILCGSVFVDVVVSAGHILQACRVLCCGCVVLLSEWGLESHG